jgi:type II secretory pathway pseudopilin PulG
VRPAFTLIELLTVMFIVIIIVAIVVPALSGARTSARSVSTRALMTNLMQSVEQFRQDNRRLPGYFTQRQMGSVQNGSRGMSAMQNMMLELAGGVVPGTSRPADAIDVGPINSGNPPAMVTVSPSLIAAAVAGRKVYYTPPAKYWVALTDANQRAGDDPNHATLPDLVDDFGTPILAWVSDEAGVSGVTQVSDFAAQDSRTPSRFYLPANAAFLRATAVGKLRRDINAQSLIGGSVSPSDAAASLMGMLGNPASPVSTTDNVQNILAAAPRGSVVLHSGGPNGVYLGRDERGGKNSMAGVLHYGLNFKSANNDLLPQRTDVLNDFDDVLVPSSN